MRGEVIKCHTTISVSLQIYNSISTPFLLSSVSLIDSLSSTCSVASPFFRDASAIANQTVLCVIETTVFPPHFAAPRRRVQRVTPCLLQTLWPKVDNTSKNHQGDVLEVFNGDVLMKTCFHFLLAKTRLLGLHRMES